MKEIKGDFLARWKDAEIMEQAKTNRKTFYFLFNDKITHNTYTVKKETNTPLSKKDRENIKKLLNV